MDWDTYSKIKKGNEKTIDTLIIRHSPKAWFFCYHLTGDVCQAGPLFIKAFLDTLATIAATDSPPEGDFPRFLYNYVFALSRQPMPPDEVFATLSPPKLDAAYAPFEQELTCLSPTLRGLYLMHTYGGMRTAQLAAVSQVDADTVDNLLQEAQAEIDAHCPRRTHDEKIALMSLSATLRNPSGSGFAQVEVPEFLLASLAHELHRKSINTDSRERKEAPSMNNKKSTVQNKVGTKSDAKAAARRADKKKKLIIWSVVALAVVILGVIFIPKLFGNVGTPTTVTTYTVDAITTGDVDTTISGSGTLTPISKDTLATTKAGTVTTLNYEVGATVEEDAVIAVLTDDNGNTTEFTAPYDGVLIELPIALEDELAANSQIAMIMGTNGFTMGIAVDELDISTVKVGQEVSFTIDAVDGDYTGTVTAVSYNGTSSGGTTAYQITAKVDYVEGVYPGMSASAEIVIESSSEGLLVPTGAIRTSGDESYIYLAPSGAEEGTEYEEDEISVDDLTKVTVETGMSDGSYTIIESDEIADGDLIVIVTLTSTQTGSSSDGSGGMGGFGGGMGGGFGGGGMNFGDFDFENFDPSQMPGGGGGFGGFGG